MVKDKVIFERFIYFYLYVGVPSCVAVWTVCIHGAFEGSRSQIPWHGSHRHLELPDVRLGSDPGSCVGAHALTEGRLFPRTGACFQFVP